MVSGEFATGNGLTSSTAPMISSLFPAGANLASTGEVILWGYVCNPMSLRRRARGNHAMVATLKRPPPEVASRGQSERLPPGAARGDHEAFVPHEDVRTFLTAACKTTSPHRGGRGTLLKKFR